MVDNSEERTLRFSPFPDLLAIDDLGLRRLTSPVVRRHRRTDHREPFLAFQPLGTRQIVQSFVIYVVSKASVKRQNKLPKLDNKPQE